MPHLPFANKSYISIKNKKNNKTIKKRKFGFVNPKTSLIFASAYY